MKDYTIFFKRQLSINDDWPSDLQYDYFVSAYTSSDRAGLVFEKVPAREKNWILLPEYKYSKDEYPDGSISAPVGSNEFEVTGSYLESVRDHLTSGRICFDITGFIRPHLLYLIKWLAHNGVGEFDAIYSEPRHYAGKEKTSFSRGAAAEVRQVIGFEGIHNPDTSKDLLIINSGYDDEAIRRTAESKENARKIQLFGFPSLQSDMYQENVLQARKAEEAVGSSAGAHPDNYFAPAHDPFVTATVLSRIVEQEDLTNLYLSPLATKAQVLGFALFFLAERQETATSIIYPISKAYSKETTKGISRVWLYTVELDAILGTGS